MVINSVTLKNFQLFKNQTINLSQLNLVTGINLDSMDEVGTFSGNGAGKSTVLNAILFGLFGEVSEINLKDLIKQGTKEATVKLECSLGKESLVIIRTIPNSLKILLNGNEVRPNTSTIAQSYLNEVLGTDFQHFRTYNCVDNKKGIDLLGLGITSLRKALMDFVNTEFPPIRQSLLSQKLDRETYNVDKKLYTFYLSDKKTLTLTSGLTKLNGELCSVHKDFEETVDLLNKIQVDIATKEKIVSYKEAEEKKVEEGICPILHQKCEKIGTKLPVAEKKISKAEIKTTQKEIKELQKVLEAEKENHVYLGGIYDGLEAKIAKTKDFIMKLKEAQKFSAYKYTAKDVQLYADAIKVLDSFSSYYITDWLSNLGVIINDLLKDLNLSVEFSIDKDFIKINNDGQLLNYSQLSSGQKKFLGTVFKIGILLQEGTAEGILLFDEGIGDLDFINFAKLLSILKNLRFQSIIIYQNCPKTIKEVTYIDIERQKGESKLK